MTREEAIAKGIVVCETKHSMLRRTPWHDYSRKGTYMLTLVVGGRRPLFGKLKNATNDNTSAYVELSPLGEAIQKEEIKKISRYYPQVEVWKLCIMPDHLHLILRVKEDLPAGKHLGMVVAGFKGGCSKAALRLGVTVPCASAQGKGKGETQGGRPGNRGGENQGNGGNGGADFGKAAGTVASVPSAFPEGRLPVLFEAGYNDKILLKEGQLDRWKHYLDDNPRRLMVKRQHPELFTVVSGLEVAGECCQAVGNRFLLDIPDKMAVIVHRRYTDEENEQLRESWLACGERGGVLVSAAIAPREKEVIREAMSRGYRVIMICENGFPPLYKPTGELFEVCSSGTLLMVSPWQYHMARTTISRGQCLFLNALAEKIVGNQ